MTLGNKLQLFALQLHVECIMEKSTDIETNSNLKWSFYISIIITR